MQALRSDCEKCRPRTFGRTVLSKIRCFIDCCFSSCLQYFKGINELRKLMLGEKTVTNFVETYCRCLISGRAGWIDASWCEEIYSGADTRRFIQKMIRDIFRSSKIKRFYTSSSDLQVEKESPGKKYSDRKHHRLSEYSLPSDHSPFLSAWGKNFGNVGPRAVYLPECIWLWWRHYS